MAVYGRSLYGTSTYGPDLRENPVPVLQIVARDRQSIQVSWPATGVGDFTNFAPVSSVALVRSLWGAPADITDGLILGRWESDVSAYVDYNVTPGARYYYGLFLLDVDGWSLASAGNVLFPRSHDYETLFSTAVPDYYYGSRVEIDGTTTYTREDAPLTRFLDVLAFAMDQVHTAVDESLRINEAHEVEDVALAALGTSLGVDVPANSASVGVRDLVAAAGKAASRRGTFAAILTQTLAATGWDAELITPRNIVADTSISGSPLIATPAFAGIAAPAWANTVAYSVGTAVTYAGATYINSGPLDIPAGASSYPGSPTAVAAQWQPYAQVPALAIGSYASERRTKSTLGASVATAPSGAQGSVATTTDLTAPAPRVFTWAHPARTTTAGTATTMNTTSWFTFAPVSFTDDTRALTRWGTPHPAPKADDGVMIASFYTDTEGVQPSVFGFSSTRQLLRVLSPDAALRQTCARVIEAGPLSGVIDAQAPTATFWSSPVLPWYGDLDPVSGQTLIRPPAGAGTLGRQVVLAGTQESGSLAVTLLDGDAARAGLVFCYDSPSDYWWATGREVWRRSGGADTQMGTYDGRIGQRLSVTYLREAPRFAVRVFLNGSQVNEQITSFDPPGRYVGLIRL